QWSDTSNPNGVWQNRAGAAAITNYFPTLGPGLVTNFNAPQPAWVAAASGPNSIPAWFKSIGAVVYVPATTTPDSTYNAPAGRVTVQKNDLDTGNDVAAANGTHKIVTAPPVANLVRPLSFRLCVPFHSA